MEAQIIEREYLIRDGPHIERGVIVVRIRRGPEATGTTIFARHVLEPVGKVGHPLLEQEIRLLLVQKVENEEVRLRAIHVVENQVV